MLLLLACRGGRDASLQLVHVWRWDEDDDVDLPPEETDSERFDRVMRELVGKPT